MEITEPMERLRRICGKLLPAAWYRRIDLENTSIRDFIRSVASTVPDGARVLDAGAGESPYAGFFSRHEYIAIDFTRGEESWAYRSLDVIGDLQYLPFTEDTFDCVVSTQVLEHVPEPGEVLAGMHRVLKPGGRLFLTAPLAFGEHQQPYDYFRYTRFGLIYLLERCGFKVESIAPRGGYFTFLAVMLMWVYVTLFPGDRSLLVKMLLFPLQFVTALVFIIILPPLLSSLDFLDPQKTTTLGFKVIALKPNVH